MYSYKFCSKNTGLCIHISVYTFRIPLSCKSFNITTFSFFREDLKMFATYSKGKPITLSIRDYTEGQNNSVLIFYTASPPVYSRLCIYLLNNNRHKVSPGHRRAVGVGQTGLIAERLAQRRQRDGVRHGSNHWLLQCDVRCSSVYLHQFISIQSFLRYQSRFICLVFFQLYRGLADTLDLFLYRLIQK